MVRTSFLVRIGSYPSENHNYPKKGYEAFKESMRVAATSLHKFDDGKKLFKFFDFHFGK
jgi:hypothetical protein